MRIPSTLLAAALYALPTCVDDELADDTIDPADAPGQAVRLDDRPASRSWSKRQDGVA